MKIVPCFIFVFLLFQCKKAENCSETNLPGCVQNIIGDTTISASLKTIRTQYVNRELHYWLNTDARTYDGEEFIINENCDTVCSLGGFRIPNVCMEKYGDDWKIVWQK